MQCNNGALLKFYQSGSSDQILLFIYLIRAKRPFFFVCPLLVIVAMSFDLGLR